MEFTITIPDAHLPIIKEAFKAMLQEKDAVDLNNPTNAEISAIAKVYLLNMIKRRVNDYRQHVHNSTFVPDELN